LPGTLRPDGSTPVLRSDNGLIFQSRRFRAACRDYRLRQEFITPYTPEQNGIVERFFRSPKEECVWQHNFHSFAEARAAIARWIQWYKAERPHQTFGYRPFQFRALQPKLVALFGGREHHRLSILSPPSLSSLAASTPSIPFDTA
jgi:putative transposase